MNNIEIIDVNKNDEDCLLIYNLRSQKKTLDFFINKENPNFKNFKKIFFEKYFLNIIPPLFAKLNNKVIAFIGHKKDENNNFFISIMLDNNYRGLGLSNIIIKKVINYIKINNNYNINNLNITAIINIKNIASEKCFIKSGFVYINNKIIDNEIYKIYKYYFV